ncbi:MAG: tRNA (adenosine(37)-N6)-threonylcarbamoyltransferase complex transferase subunit TsaD [Candidatus Doudnabacteria bacterium]
MNQHTKILAIETSCDETAAAVVISKGNEITPLSSIVSSQIKLHQSTQGVVPEVAARAHFRKINSVVKKALKDADLDLEDIDYLAVTRGPGLITSLLVGTEFVKALSYATGKKIIPVNHMAGHLYSAFLDNPKLQLPSINLIVSGGHTYIVLLSSKNKIKVLGQTIDDAAGEAFDKVAKMLKLPYPGGPQISKYAEKGLKDFQFPRPMQYTKNYNFSFAGLKTAVLYKIRDEKLDVDDFQTKCDLAYSFQNAAVSVLIEKTIRAAKEYNSKSITLSGGVAANKKLREDLMKAGKKNGLHQIFVPNIKLCTDNALMIANAAAIKLQSGFKPVGYKSVSVDPGLEF